MQTIINSNNKSTYYYINDKNKNKRWIFPFSLETPTFLNLYNTNGWKGKLYKVLVKIVFKLKLQKYFVSGITDGDLEEKYKTIIKNLKGINYSIFTGTAGENKKIIIEVNDGKETKHFIKIPTTVSATKLVQYEKKNINYLEELNFKIFNFPQIVYSDNETIAISNIKPKEVLKDDSFSSIHFLALGELYTNTSVRLISSKIKLFISSVQYIESLNTLELTSDMDRLKINLSNFRKSLIYNKNEITVSFAHCDFTPWNMYVTKDKLYVYDWELASENTPLLFDFFHYIFQQAILIKHKNYPMIKKEIQQFLNNKELKAIIEKYEIDFNEYYGYYLFINISYYALKYANQEDLHIQAYWLIDVWNDALENFIEKKGEVFELN